MTTFLGALVRDITDTDRLGRVVDSHPTRGWLVFWTGAQVAEWRRGDTLADPPARKAGLRDIGEPPPQRDPMAAPHFETCGEAILYWQASAYRQGIRHGRQSALMWFSFGLGVGMMFAIVFGLRAAS